MPSDLRTKAIVLRRTNYSESDRILNLLTPGGKVAVIAHGVRKAKSRLAGGIELFTLAEVVIHQGKSDLGTLTSARMLKSYHNILGDVERLELAGKFLRRLERVSEQIPNPEYFVLLEQALLGLDRGLSVDLVRTWLEFNLTRASGEEINLLRDVSGAELSPDLTYRWHPAESALMPDMSGLIGAREIKFARFLLSNPLLLAAKVEHYEQSLPALQQIVQSLV